jgi:diacylglycerol kinase family enzyme
MNDIEMTEQDFAEATPADSRPREARTKIAVVLNHTAGALLDRDNMHELLVAQFERLGFDPDFVPAEAGGLAERMKIGCESGAAMLVVAGGDGTITCGAKAAMESGLVLGVLPFGTMNLLAKDLGLPVGDMEAALGILKTGRERTIDVAEVNGHIYLCASMLGLPARLARYREASRGQASFLAWRYRFIRAALRALARAGTPRWSLRVDGERADLRAASLVIAPNPLDDRAGQPFHRARLDGGLLELYAIKHMSLTDVIRLAAKALTGWLRGDPDLTRLHAREVIVARSGRRSGQSIRVMNDGEIHLLEPPLVYRIRPRALRVMAPTELE